jgi:DNA polymerase-4
LKDKNYAAGSVVMKLKTDGFRILTRQRPAEPPTQLAERLYRLAEPMLVAELDGRKFRLIGLGASDLHLADEAVDKDDLLTAATPGESTARLTKLEEAMSAIRSKGGDGAIYKGRAIRSDKP